MAMRLLILILAAPYAFVAAGCNQQGTGDLSVPLVVEVARTPWQTGQAAGEVLTTMHYRIYTTAKRPMVLRHLPGFMEAAHASYLALTARRPPFTDYTPAERTSDFTSVFGDDWRMLQARFMRFMAAVR